MFLRKKIHAPAFVLKVLLLLLCCLGGNLANAAEVISLAGQWQFKADPQDLGVSGKWFTTSFAETVTWPGSMAGNDKGDDITLKTKWTGSIYDSSWFFNPRLAKYRQPDNIKIPFWLTPNKYYVGPAWYRKQVTVPANWEGQRIVLNLERAHTETRVWVDAAEIGLQNSMVVAHQYDLTKALTPGPHTITVRVDNRIKTLNVGPDSNSLTDHTQGNWNGIIGQISLEASSPVYLADVQVYPDLKSRTAKVKLTIQNTLTQEVKGQVTLAAKSFNTTTRTQEVKPQKASFAAKPGKNTLEVALPLGKKMLLWDEFDPALYQLTTSVQTTDKQRAEKQVQFGMREFKVKGNRLTVNDRPVFLRGTVNNCEFPLTGYPPMDVPAWERIFKIARAHGLNHMRFHSWCPPEAAFVAADKIGFYLQPEGPSWPNHGTSLGDGKPVDQFIYDETNRMEQAYGNYASYCMLSAGNEPAGRNQAKYLAEFVKYWQARDTRRVYTGASVAMSWPLVPENEYMIKSGSRGLPWVNKGPEAATDYRAAIEKFPMPYVTHEMGQWCVFPNFKEIAKYTGIYKARNMELFQQDLADRGMGAQGADFLLASGKLQALCYKSEIEKSLRTPGLAGFQMLGLQDFPGQGTALVGVLDAFWDEKGYISPQEYSRFCSATVPLGRLPKFVYTNAETFETPAELYHFGPQDLQKPSITWTIKDPSGTTLASGTFDAKTIPTGTNTPLGTVRFPLAGITKATKLKLEIAVAKTSFANDWDIWVYPATLPTLASNDVYYCTSLDAKAQEVLNQGGKVFLNGAGKVVKGKEVIMNFTPVFWNTSWFKMRPPHVTGFLTNAKHPALADFPSENYSNLQWWEIVNRAQVMILEDFPAGFTPIVQPIDTWFINRRLGLIMEAKVGKGKLILSSADLSAEPSHGPAARQLYYSLMRYMQSEQFNPAYAVDFKTVQDIFETPSKETFMTYTKDSPDELKPKAK